MCVVFVGGHAGNKTLILNQFIDCEGKTLAKQLRTIHMLYSEESLTKRLKRQTSTNLHQLEAMHMVTQNPLQYTKRSRKFFEGSPNAGNIFGPIATLDPSATWLTTYREKKEMYASFRAPVGGTVENDENEGRGKRKRQDSDIEPMSLHSTQREVHLELLHSHPPPPSSTSRHVMVASPWHALRQARHTSGLRSRRSTRRASYDISLRTCSTATPSLTTHGIRSPCLRCLRDVEALCQPPEETIREATVTIRETMTSLGSRPKASSRARRRRRSR